MPATPPNMPAAHSQTPTPTTSLTTSRSPSPKPRHVPPPGLGNLGNTCYLNSVVQVLYHIAPFRAALLAWAPPPPRSFAADLVAALRQVFVALDCAQTAADALRASFDSLPARRTPSPPLVAARARPRSPHRPVSPPFTPTPRRAPRAEQDRLPDPAAPTPRDHPRPVDLPDPEFEPDTFCDDDEGFLGDDEEDPAEAVLDANTESVPADGTREGIDFINPQNIIGLLRDEHRCTEFDARGQQDAHEFLRFLLDKVNDCFQRCQDDYYESMDDPRNPGVPGSSVTAPISTFPVAEEARSSAETRGDASPVDGRSPASKRRRCEQDDHHEPDHENRTTPQRDPPASPHSQPSPVPEGGKAASRAAPSSAAPSSAAPSSAAPSSAVPASAPPKRPRKQYKRDLVRELFEGKAVTATRCDECERRTERSEQFLDVSLPVEAGKSLAWAWSSQGARENLIGDNKYSCEKCQTYTEAQRWWQLAELPEVLTVHLKLFAVEAYPGAGGKVPVAMPCPVSMKFTEWCSLECPERDDEYSLTAVIVHEGTGASSGHYYSYIYKPEKGGWYIFDDNFVTPVAESEMNERLFTSMRSRRTAYVLFYTHDQQK